MEKHASIVQIQDYGSIHIKLKDLLDARGMSRNSLARAVNTRFEVVDKWYRGQVEKIDADILARMCYVLDCRVEELLEYTAREG